MSRDYFITRAAPGDAPAIAALLREAELPHEDFAPHAPHFLVARDVNQHVVGAIGAEVYGADALLRSFVVAVKHRSAGVGRKLLEAIEHAAADWGVERWWLLTTTAEGYFAARGFQRTPRAAVPAMIAATGEFRELCPSVATCLFRERRSA